MYGSLARIERDYTGAGGFVYIFDSVLRLNIFMPDYRKTLVSTSELDGQTLLQSIMKQRKEIGKIDDYEQPFGALEEVSGPAPYLLYHVPRDTRIGTKSRDVVVFSEDSQTVRADYSTFSSRHLVEIRPFIFDQSVKIYRGKIVNTNLGETSEEKGLELQHSGIFIEWKPEDESSWIEVGKLLEDSRKVRKPSERWFNLIEWRERRRNTERDLDLGLRAAKAAGNEIMKYYGTELEVKNKSPNGSNPQTIADRRANELICSILYEGFPDAGIMSEEELDSNSLPENLRSPLRERTERWKDFKYVWVVDPLDGTRHFIKRRKEFGVNIALVREDETLVGVNYYPVFSTCYYASINRGAFVERNGHISGLRVSQKSDPKKMVVVAAHVDEQIENMCQRESLPQPLKAASLGYKMCIVAEGIVDALFVKRGKGNTWDVCSGQLIVEEAKGQVTNLDGEKINPREIEIPDLVVTNGLLHEPALQMIGKHR